MEENKNLNINAEENFSEQDAPKTTLPDEEGIEEEGLALDSSEIATEEAETEEKPEYVPKNKYEKALYGVYRDEGLSEILRVSSLAIVAVTVYAFFVHLLKIVESAPLVAIELLIITGVPFVALSVMRKMINAPRPYELLEFYEKKPREKSGCSFPSRHVFSVFVIATVIVPTNIALGVGLFVLGSLLAAMRVLLGVHFIRDVVAGALVGVVSGVVGILTLFLI